METTTGEEGNKEREKSKEKKNLIKIPSYQEVFGTTSTSSSHNPSPPPPAPATSFSQAFSFIKSSEFYSPPPQPPPPPPPETTPRETGADVSSSERQASSSNRAILVSHRQKGNPLLKHIRNVRWIFADVVCDYLISQSTCALYLSLRYHLLHPDYLYFRIRELQKNFKLRIILCHVDVEDVIKPLQEVTKTSLLHDCTLVCAWSLEECGRYLETMKVYENKPADLIREQPDADYLSRLKYALTSIRHVNKTDVLTLGSSFGSLSQIMDSSMEELARCPGIGEKKVKRLYDTFHEPFKRVLSRPNIVIPDTPDREKNKNEGELKSSSKENETESSKSKKDLSVKSALSAAFEKYNERVQSKGKNKITEMNEAFKDDEGNI
ncbi:hypothetical protein LUZ60_014717 [Juncus effusus]|nr:hypothetical protein LUZ60_014717 [Juncus effusus]